MEGREEEAGCPGREVEDQPASAATSSGEESNESTSDPLADYFVRHKARPGLAAGRLVAAPPAPPAPPGARRPRPARSRFLQLTPLPQVTKHDTLEGLAVKYNVTVSRSSGSTQQPAAGWPPAAHGQ